MNNERNNERDFDLLVNNIINGMTKDLSDEQLRKLKDTLYISLNNYNVEKNPQKLPYMTIHVSKLCKIF